MPSKYEVASEETVPAARTIIAKALIQKYGMRETEVARHLGVAQAAVSKYMTGKYSESMRQSVKKVEGGMGTKRELIEGYIEKIAQGKQEFVNVCICTMCGTANGFYCAFSHAEGKGQRASGAKV